MTTDLNSLFQLPTSTLIASTRDLVESIGTSSYSEALPLRHYRCQVGDHVICRPDMDPDTDEIECADGETLVSIFKILNFVCLFLPS